MTLRERDRRKAELEALYLSPQTVEEMLSQEFPEQQEEQIQEIAETGGERSEVEQLAYENEVHRSKILSLLEERILEQKAERDAEMRDYFTKAVDMNFRTLENVAEWIKEVYDVDEGSMLILITKKNGKMMFDKNPPSIRLARPDNKTIDESTKQNE